jgi:P27 family predicted phage terminase small subunit
MQKVSRRKNSPGKPVKRKPQAKPKPRPKAKRKRLPVIAPAITADDPAGVPAWLGPVAAAKWAEIHALLADRRLIDDRDRDAVALYCDAWQQLSDANATIKKEGEYFTTEKGYVGLHPAVLKRRKAVDVIRKLGEQLGLTPRARTNLAAANRPAKSDPLQQFLTKRPG